jgi:cellulose synthase/poly-beta-1,6-N-acetylglucosamine synthase-like glycosyltransferase
MSGPASWQIGAIVPARDEQQHIEACIRSLIRAAASAHCGDRFWVVVVADACRDETAAVAWNALEGHGEVIVSDAGSAGAARRLGVEAALAHFQEHRPEHIWLCNTDADSVVPGDWMSHQLALAEQGITGVAGIIALDASADSSTREFFRRTYRIHAGGTHEHVHGANLSLRADAYLDVGGWRDLALAEDHCLWRRLLAKGWRVCSPAESVVTTSARLVGRARGGFADTLRGGIGERCS